MQLLRASDVVVLGIAASGTVTVYSLTRYVPEAIFNVVAIVISAVMPGLGGLMGAGDTTRAAAVRSQSMAGTWLIATAAGAAFLLVNEWFLDSGSAPVLPGVVAALLIVVMTFQFALSATTRRSSTSPSSCAARSCSGSFAGAIGLAVLLMKTRENPLPALTPALSRGARSCRSATPRSSVDPSSGTVHPA